MVFSVRFFLQLYMRDTFPPFSNIYYIWVQEGEATAEWKRLHKEEFYALYSSPNFIRVIKSRGMRWVELIARMGERRGAYRIFMGRPDGRRPLGSPRADGRIILKWTFNTWDGEAWTKLMWLRVGRGNGFCKCCDELSVFIKCGEFID